MTYAIVTGGSRGIGRAIALALAADGRNLVITYRNRADAAQKVCAAAQALGVRCEAAPIDLGKADVAAAIEGLLAQHGPPAILVNNAGVTMDGLFPMMGEDAWNTVLTTNLGSFYEVTRPVVRRMLRARSGRIVNMTSVCGQRGNAGQVNYAASKAGLIGATKALALELAPRGITVNAVAPGLISTDMTAGISPDVIADGIPMGRAGEPEEVAHLVAFLCSAKASYITGQVVGINGGLYT